MAESPEGSAAGSPGDWTIGEVVTYYDGVPYTVLGSDIGSFSVVDSVPTIACHILVNGQLALCDWAFTEGRYGAVLRGAHQP